MSRRRTAATLGRGILRGLVLHELRLKDWVLVEEARIELAGGLNVVTGETGAGKSLLVGAMQALLGDRVRADVVRAGAPRAEVEAVFGVLDEPVVRGRLSAAGLPADEELLVRRVVERAGRSRCYLNGRLAVGALLRDVTGGLVDLSSQHEHHRLANPGSHLEFLDLFAGAADRTARMGDAYAALRQAADDLATADLTAEERSAAEDVLRFQFEEIETASPRPGELEHLVAQRERARHAGRLQEVASVAEEVLYGRDGSVCGELAKQGAALGALGHLDARIEDAARRIRSSAVEIEEVARDLSRLARSVDHDPEALARMEERLVLLQRLARKHGGDLEGVFAARERIARELAALGGHEEHVAELRIALEAAHAVAAEIARGLSRHRREAAGTLASRISAELAELGMGGARVEVEVTRLRAGGDGEAGLSVDGARLGPTGVDRAEILVAPNPGEPARPLSRIASGGELSRAMLAVKTVLSGLGPSGTYVFDEVDAGVGGATAEIVGRKLRDIARHHQVLCVTHLPQVASLANRHFVVEKRKLGSRTVSAVRQLGARERDAEVARMIGGLRVTKKTRAAAKEMVRMGRRAVQP